jgi:2-oxoacid:acceptor oxidoreductase gamma subunit (pyruvate/2-ketoisovalerate family)
MQEIRMHGRGGQGLAIAAEMLVAAFVAEGKYASSFPMFGSERRGAPVAAFLRFGDEPIREKTQVYEPDCVVVFDPMWKNLKGVFDGLKEGSVVILNTTETLRDRLNPNVKKVGFVDATGIALKRIGIPVPNTCMLGAFSAVTEWLSLQSVIRSFKEYFNDKAFLANRSSSMEGFQQAKIIEW